MRNLIRRVLKEAGYEIVGEAKDGKEGVKLYFELKPDFVTMDIKMPEKTGIEATKEILSKDPDANIIFITGISDEKIKEEALQTGAKGYLQKPFQPVTLLEKLEKIEVESQKTKESTSSPLSSTNRSVTIHSDEEVVDDFFEEMEIELKNEPNEEPESILVVENDEDVFEFPEDFSKEEERYSLSNETTKNSSVSPSNSPNSTIPVSEHHSNHTNTSQVNSTSSSTTPLTSSPSRPKEIVPPIQIRPPKGKKARPSFYQETIEDIDMEEPVLDFSSDSNQEERKSLFDLLKQFFKKKSD